MIIPTLKTLQVEKGFGEVSVEVNAAVSGCFKEVVKKYKDVSITMRNIVLLTTITYFFFIKQDIEEGHRFFSKGKEPALLTDVAKIISSMPDGHRGRAAEASAFLFGVTTGARVSTVVGVCLSDISMVSHCNKTGDTSLMV